jgi:hypothetical protein
LFGDLQQDKDESGLSDAKSRGVIRFDHPCPEVIFDYLHVFGVIPFAKKRKEFGVLLRRGAT